MTNASTPKPWRSAAAPRIALVAAACAAAFLGAYDYFSGNAASIAEESPVIDTTTSSPGVGDESTPFTTASEGDCLTWQVGSDGTFSDFQTTDCASDHRFEVSTVENLAIYPTSEFGPDAEMPSMERQAQLREELCQGSTLNYLDGQFDPAGKYSIAPILPPTEAWANGDRTMLCGLQTTDENGIPQETQGRVSEVDQANIAAPGACREIGDDQVLRTVDCSEPHQLETVSVVNLAEHFTDGTPSVEDQNDYLAQRCNDDAIAYMGEEENLYQSTLQPYWDAISETSWNGGTRSVNCSLIHAGEDGNSFSEIIGTAQDGRDGLTINGAPPTEQPERNPLRENSGDDSEPADSNSDTDAGDNAGDAAEAVPAQ
ncbi:septum formation family protein [Corynebacterium sp. L4756]|uniref:septum formation family protein n=1 Tax=unclassified Corynebacterium TaxID=2624378 RepID=UPI00374D773A